MGIVKRQSIKLSIVTYLGTVIGFANVILLFPGIFTEAQIGVFLGLIIPFAVIFMHLAMLGSGQVFIRYFPNFKNKENGHNGMLPYALLWFLIGSAFFVTIFSLGFEQFAAFLPEFSLLPQFMEYIVATTVLMGLATLLSVLCQNFFRVVVPGLILRTGIKVTLLLGAVCYYMKWINFETFLLFIPAHYFLAAVFLYFYNRRLGGYRMKTNKTFFKKLPHKEMASYGLYAVLLGLGNNLVYKIDLLMVPLLSDLASGGKYVIAERMSLMVDIPTASLLVIVSPLIAAAWQKKDVAKIGQLYKDSSLNLLILGVFIACILITNLNHIYAIMPNGANYEAGKIVVVLLILGKLFDMATSCNGHIIQFSEKFRVNFYILLMLAVINIILNIVLIPAMGIKGAAIATAISLTGINLFKLIYVKYKFGIQPFTFQTVKILVLGGAILTLTYLVPDFTNPWIGLIVKSGIVAILYGLTVYFLKISLDVNDLVKKGAAFVGINLK